MEIDFDELIDKHVARESRPKTIGRYYPSEIGSCIRKVWYTYKYPREVDPKLRKVFELGNILHDFIVEVIKSDKTPEVKLLKAELPFKFEIDDFIVSGRVDDLMLLKADNTKYLVEVKSTKNVKGVKKALPHHVVQLQFYMHATNVHDGILLYVDKSTMGTKSFQIKYSKEETQKIIGKFKSLHSHLIKETLPIDEAKRREDTKWMCTYCEYKPKCDKKEK